MGWLSNIFKSKPQTSSSGTDFTNAQKPFGPELFQEAQGAYKQGKQTGAYTGPTLAQESPLITQAQNQAVQTAGTLGNVTQGNQLQQRLGENVLSGDYRAPLNQSYTAASDPNLMQGAIKSALVPLQRDFTENFLPQVGSAAVNAGAFGGSKQDELELRGLRDYNEGAQNIAATFAYQDQARRQELEQQDLAQRRGLAPQIYGLEQSGAAQVPQLQSQNASNALLPSQIIGNIGEQQTNRNQTVLDDAQKRFYAPQEYGQALLNNYINQFGQISDAGKTSVATGARPSTFSQFMEGAKGIKDLFSF